MSNWLDALPIEIVAHVFQIPLLVTVAISAAAIRKDAYGRWGKEFALVGFGMWLLVWWFTLAILQLSINLARPDPFNPADVYYGFPSSVGYYSSVIAVFIIEFTFMWNIIFSRLYWMGLYLCLIVPSIVLCWFQFNSWQEVLLSMGLGALVTTMYIAILYGCLTPIIPILINTPPCTWFSCVDTWVQDKEGQAATERLRRRFEEILEPHSDPTGSTGP